MKTNRWTTWNSNRLLQGGLQVNNVNQAHRTIYTDWLQQFDACVTENINAAKQAEHGDQIVHGVLYSAKRLRNPAK